MFDDIFGGGSFGWSSWPWPVQKVRTRGYDLETEVELDLEDVLDWCDRVRSGVYPAGCLQQHATGTGAKPGTDPSTMHGLRGQGR